MNNQQEYNDILLQHPSNKAISLLYPQYINPQDIDLQDIGLQDIGPRDIYPQETTSLVAPIYGISPLEIENTQINTLGKEHEESSDIWRHNKL